VKRRALALTALVIVICIAQSSALALVNPGFETGDFNGWTVNIPGGDAQATVLSSFTTDKGNVITPSGNYMACLRTDGPGSVTSVAQSVSMTSGQALGGWAAFDARDYLPYDDYAEVRILVEGGILAIPWHSSVSAVGDYGDSLPAGWNFIAPADGLYTVEYCVANVGDSALESYALFDAAVVPEPSSLLVLGSGGLMGLLGFIRRKR